MKPRGISQPARWLLPLGLGLLLSTDCTPIETAPQPTPPGEMARPDPPPAPPPPIVVADPTPVAVEPAAPVAAPPLPPVYVEFFSEPNYRGESFIVEAGAAVDNLARLDPGHRSWNHRISSFRLQGIATVVAFAESDFRGERLESSSSLGDLVAERRGGPPGANWDHAIASLRVVPARPRPDDPGPHYDARTAENVVRRAYHDVLNREPDAAGLRAYGEKLMDGRLTEDALRTSLQQSPEYHALDFDAIITRAYREVLKRAPDAEGLKHYHQLMAERGWTEPQLRADLLRSAEERTAAIRALVTRAYRDVLGRDPDRDGLAHYEQLVRDKGWSDREVRAALMKSDEYRQKQGVR